MNYFRHVALIFFQGRQGRCYISSTLNITFNTFTQVKPMFVTFNMTSFFFFLGGYF